MTDPTKEKKEKARLLAGELGEYKRGNLAEVEHREATVAAGITDDETRDLLTFAEQAWNRRKEPDEPEFAETTWAHDRLQQARNTEITDAVEQQNISKMSHQVGWPSYEPDVSGLHTATQLENWLCTSERCKLIYLAALMGRGKTDLSLSFYQLIHRFYQRARDALREVEGGDPSQVPTPEFAANFRVDTPDGAPFVHNINNFDRLVDWGRRGSSADVRWYIFDEASTELTAQSGANAQDVAETMGPFVKKMRKMGVNMIVIGHDAGDVHVAIRSLADYVDKIGLKSASFYSGVNNREGVGHLFDVSGIPPTDWGFDTDDLAEWSWGSALDDTDEQPVGMTDSEVKQEIARRGYRLYEQTGLSQSEVAAALDTADDGGIRVTQADISRAGKSLEPVESAT